MEETECSYTVGGNLSWYSIPTMENSVEVPQKLKIELPYDTAISLLGVYPEKRIHTPQCSLQPCLYNSQGIEAT